jgi:hypothetical protein
MEILGVEYSINELIMNKEIVWQEKNFMIYEQEFKCPREE